MQEEIRRGKLSSKRKWHLVVCEMPDSNLKEGRHLILEGMGQPRPDELTRNELQELRLLTFDLAEELASAPGQWRVDSNGPGVATLQSFHSHIKLPADSDKLARLVG